MTERNANEYRFNRQEFDELWNAVRRTANTFSEGQFTVGTAEADCSTDRRDKLVMLAAACLREAAVSNPYPVENAEITIAAHHAANISVTDCGWILYHVNNPVAESDEDPADDYENA